MNEALGDRILAVMKAGVEIRTRKNHPNYEITIEFMDQVFHEKDVDFEVGVSLAIGRLQDWLQCNESELIQKLNTTRVLLEKLK